MNFSEMPHDFRMAVRNTVNEFGGNIDGYNGEELLVAMPNGKAKWELIKAMKERHGMADIADDGSFKSWCFFPICSDNTPPHQRHDGNYPGSKGFYLYVNFRKECA